MDQARYREAERRLWASVGVEPVERRVRLAGAGVDIRVQEIGSGQPVLFIHGGSINGTSWAALAAKLDGFHCLLIDRPGCGLSEPLATGFADVTQLEAFADAFVADVLDALELDSALVVATSFGGYFALRSTAADPARVSRLVEIAYPIGAPIAGVPFVMRLAAVPPIGRLMTSIPPTRGTVKAMLRQIGLANAMKAGRVSDEMIDWFQSQLRDTDTLRNELAAGPPFIRPMKGLDIGMLHTDELLGSIDTPVSFIWGDADPMGGRDTAEAFVARFPNAELTVVPGLGHAPWIDDPAKIAELTEAALSR